MGVGGWGRWWMVFFSILFFASRPSFFPSSFHVSYFIFVFCCTCFFWGGYGWGTVMRCAAVVCLFFLFFVVVCLFVCLFFCQIFAVLLFFLFLFRFCVLCTSFLFFGKHLPRCISPRLLPFPPPPSPAFHPRSLTRKHAGRLRSHRQPGGESPSTALFSNRGRVCVPFVAPFCCWG